MNARHDFGHEGYALAQYGDAMSWKQFVARHVRGRSQADFAVIVGVSQGTVSRWLKGTQVAEAGLAIEVARAVNEPPLDVLVQSGFLTPKEAGAAISAPADLSQLSNDELLELVRARMSREVGEGRAERPAPNTDAGETPAVASIFDHPAFVSDVDDSMLDSDGAAAAQEDSAIQKEAEELDQDDK